MKPIHMLVLVGVIVAVSAWAILGNRPDQNQTTTSQFDEIVYQFVGEYTPLTELQKKEDWNNQHKGRVIEGSGVVKEIVVSSNLVKIEHPKNKYENGASISFRYSDGDLLSKLKIGDPIRFSGQLDNYSNSEGLIVGDAVLSQS